MEEYSFEGPLTDVVDCHELRFADVGGKKEDVLDSIKFLRRCENVEELKIANIHMDRAIAFALSKTLCNLGKLRKLTVWHSHMGCLEASIILQGCKNCPRLHTIDFSGNSLKVLHSISNLFQEIPKLQYLSLNYCGVPEQQAYYLLHAAKNCKELCLIDLRNNGFSKPCIQNLYAIASLIPKREVEIWAATEFPYWLFVFNG